MSSYAPIVKQNLSNTNISFPQYNGANSGINRHKSDKDLSYVDQTRRIISDSSYTYANQNGTHRKPVNTKQSYASYSSIPYAYISHNDLSLYKYQTNQIPLTSGMLPLQSTNSQLAQYPQNPMQRNNRKSVGHYASEPESNYDSDIGALSSKYTSLDRRRDDEPR